MADDALLIKDNEHHLLSPSFPIHGKSVLLVYGAAETVDFQVASAKLLSRGAAKIKSLKPGEFLSQLVSNPHDVVHEFDFMLISIPVVGVGAVMAEPPPTEATEGLTFGMFLSKTLAEAMVDIPCIATTRARSDGTDALQGSFRFVLYKPISMHALETLIQREELFGGYAVDLDISSRQVCQTFFS